jgi:hypothetical protein
MLPLAVGLMAVGAAGTAYGMMKPRQKYTSPNYNDIDLSRDNPALYAELQKYEEMGKQLEALYNQRKTGPNASEMRMRDQAMADQRASLAARGSLGGSTELLAGQDLNQRFQDEVMQRAFQEQQALMAQRLAQGQAQAGMFANAQQNIYGNMANANMLDYQSRMAQDQARNQMFSGLMGAGIGAYGANQQAGAMAANTAALQAQNQAYQGIPQQPQYQMAPAYAAPAYQPNPYNPYSRIG